MPNPKLPTDSMSKNLGRLLSAMFHPGPSPANFWRDFFAVVLVGLLGLGLIIGLNYDASRPMRSLSDPFREGHAATIFFVAIMAMGGARAISNAVIASPALSPRWRRFIHGFAIILLVMTAAAIALLLLGSALHNRFLWFFQSKHYGDEIYRTVFGSFVVMLVFAWQMPPRSCARFWLLIGWLFWFLSFDDLATFHEDFCKKLALKRLELSPEHWFSVHANDLMLIGYALVAALIGLRFAHSLARVPRSTWIFASATVPFALTTVFDFASAGVFQEELAKSIMLLLVCAGTFTARSELLCATTGRAPIGPL